MKKTKIKHLVACTAAISAVAIGCAKKPEAPSAEASAPVKDVMEAPAQQAVETTGVVARLERGLDLVDVGSVVFSNEGVGVRIVAHITDVPPGVHGLHIHEIGDCSAADFKSAGGHFNPTESAHGAPTDDERHAGDLGNIEIGADGSGHVEVMTDRISLGEGENSVLGRAVILHAKADDLVSQPTGAAGARLACGVIAADGAG